MAGVLSLAEFETTLQRRMVWLLSSSSNVIFSVNAGQSELRIVSNWFQIGL